MDINYIIESIFSLKENLNIENTNTLTDYLIEDMMIKENIEVKRIFSTNIFPCMLTIEEKEYLIWDENWLSIYSLYLYAIIADNEGLHDEGLFFLKASTFLFLSLKFDEHSKILTHAFEKMTNVYLSKSVRIIQENEYFKDILCLDFVDEYLMISSLYIAIHEMFHHILKNNLYREEQATVIKLFINAILKDIKGLNEKEYKKLGYSISQTEITEYLSYCISGEDKEIMDEIIADINAKNQCYKYCEELFQNKYSKSKIDAMCHEVMKTVDMLTINYINIFYDWYYEFFPSDTSYNIEVEKHISAINRFLAQNLVSDIFDQTIFKRSIITKEKKFNRESLNILQKYKNKLGIKMLPSKYREKLKKQLFN